MGRGSTPRVTAEHGRRRRAAAAVAAQRRSRRRAGERGELTRARAPVGKGEAIPVLGLDGGVAERAVDDEAELGRRRWRTARVGANPARGMAGAGLDQVEGLGEEAR
jgi:hypothetical protein